MSGIEQAEAESIDNSMVDDAQDLNSLITAVGENLYSADAHINLINKLHDLSMIEELEQARSDMKSIIAPSEGLWLQQIQDYFEWNRGREEIQQLFSEAIKSCPTVDIVERYGNFILEEYQKNSDYAIPLDFATALELTQYNIPDGHKVWNIYRDYYMLRIENEKKVTTPTNLLNDTRNLYLSRLRIPHTEISSTFSDFSSFITSYFNDKYESEMVSANKIYTETRKSLEYRDSWEISLKSNPSLQLFADYIQWELERPKKYFRPELIASLYERALRLYQYIPEVWDDYIIFVCEQEKTFTRSQIESIIKRATDSCPSSGALWAHSIRISESYGLDMESIIMMKMKIDEIPMFSSDIINNYNSWKALILAWLPFLYRINKSTDDMFLEQLFTDCNSSFQQATVLGKEDEYFEVEYLVINLFSKLQEVELARDCWKKVSKYQGRKNRFWLKYFEWEKVHGDYQTALNVLKIPLSRSNIDWPEMIVQAYVEFERLEGSSYSTQQSVIEARRKRYSIAKKLHEESIKQQEEILKLNKKTAKEEKKQEKKQEKQQERVQVDDTIVETTIETSETKKRGRSDDSNNFDSPSKQQKTSTRDREHNTVIISNLPSDTSEEDLEQFFNDCGDITSINQNADSNSAIIEFSDQADTKTALTKDRKAFKDGGEVRITSGYQTTLFVTNFPSSTSKESLTELFKPYGQIISIRFPSLKYNTHRRFCYIQFLESESAIKASKELDDSLQFDEKEKLLVKISDPSNKQSRSGGFSEGRELFVKGFDFNTTEELIHSAFGKYGTIEKLKIPPSKRPGRLNDGYCFITFSTVDEANAAVDGLNNNVIVENGRSISVTISGKSNKLDKGLKEKGGSDNSKKIYISNLSDTTEDQLRSIVEKYGLVKAITLRTDLEGAIVEYESVSDAGKASLALEGYIISERPIQIGTSIKPPQKQLPPPKKSTIFVPPRARKRH